MDNTSKRSQSYDSCKRTIICLATLLILNPIAIFFLKKSLIATIFISLGVFILIQVTLTFQRFKLFTIYLFNCIALVSILIHAEIILHNIYPSYVIKNLYTYKDGYYFNTPLLKERFLDKEFAASYHTNIQGIRIAAEQDPRKTVTQTDWLVLGDSFTQAAQVNFEKTYTSRLNSRFPDKSILNVGISGMGIGDEYNYFIKDGFRFRPSYVILQLCSFNDFMNVQPQGITLTDKLMNDWAILRLLLSKFRYQNPAELPLGRWTEPFQPDHDRNSRYNIFYNSTSKIKQEDIAMFRRYVEEFNKAVVSTGAELLIVLIPTREQVQQHSLKEVTKQFSIDSDALDMERPNKLLRKITNQLQIDFVDLLPSFSDAKEKMFFDYDEHMTKFGHKVFANAVGNFIEAKQGKSNARLMTSDFGVNRYPMYSADGRKISYQSLRDGNMELFIADSNLNNERRLTFNNINETHPSLSKDATQIIFTEGSAELLTTEVVLMNINGTEKRTITKGDLEFGAIPTFSPSNRQITYASWNYDPQINRYTTPRIVVRDLKSEEVKFITNGQHDVWRPVFSPDERELVYIVRTDNQYDLHAYNLSNGIERRLTNTSFDEWDPQFTPDGFHVVYAAKPDGNWDLFLHDLRNSATIRLTETTGHEWDPSISPDGSTILFAGSFGLIETVYSMPFPR